MIRAHRESKERGDGKWKKEMGYITEEWQDEEDWGQGRAQRGDIWREENDRKELREITEEAVKSEQLNEQERKDRARGWMGSGGGRESVQWREKR